MIINILYYLWCSRRASFSIDSQSCIDSNRTIGISPVATRNDLPTKISPTGRYLSHGWRIFAMSRRSEEKAKSEGGADAVDALIRCCVLFNVWHWFWRLRGRPLLWKVSQYREAPRNRADSAREAFWGGEEFWEFGSRRDSHTTISVHAQVGRWPF